MCGWGGLVFINWFLRPLLDGLEPITADEVVERIGVTYDRFSALVIGSVVLTGLLRVWRMRLTLNILSSTYGKLLLMKMGMVSLMLLLL
ncbi:MAG: hypothetical protein ACE5KH_00210 [Candidatus Geothermarchaeales archaeon]